MPEEQRGTLEHPSQDQRQPFSEPDNKTLSATDMKMPPTPLSEEEKVELACHEEVIQRGITGFIEVGRALQKIHDGKLYRGTHKTFGAYVRDRFAIGRAHAYRLIDVAAVVKNLSPSGDMATATEFSLRPLTKVPPEEQLTVWERATQLAGNGKPTARLVAKALRDLAPEPRDDPNGGKVTLPTAPTPARSPKAPVQPASGEPALPETCSVTRTDAKSGSGESVDEEDFTFADGSTMLFSEWIYGFLPVDRIRNQLKAVRGGREDLSVEQVAEITYIQKLVVAFAVQLNRLTPGSATPDEMLKIDTHVNGICRGLKAMILGTEEAACRIGNVLRTPASSNTKPQKPIPATSEEPSGDE